MLKDKIILITGGTGSFGQKFVEIVLKEFDPKIIRIFSRDEVKQGEMQKRFTDSRLRFFIGNVRDEKRLLRAMRDVDIVIHAAALKQVPTCEYNVNEAVKTNINGAINVIDAAIDCKIKKVITLSTDKNCHPVNLYGATKLVAEKLFIQANIYTPMQTKFSCVRYGNVAESRGSIIPLFKEQKAKGIVTITNEKMTRFWITQEEAVRFIIDCIDRMKGGEIFIPKMSSIKISQLASIIAPKAQQKIIGIRPGEKINEILLSPEEVRHSLEFNKYFVIEPEFAFWSSEHLEDGKKLPENFEYSSDKNEKWLDEKSLKFFLKEKK